MQDDDFTALGGQGTEGSNQPATAVGTRTASLPQKYWTRLLPFVLWLLLLSPVASFALPAGTDALEPAADAVLAAIRDTGLHTLIAEVLERSPHIAALAAGARAAAEKAPQVSALPDPTVGITAYLLAPQTRVGPQRTALTLAQRFPWFGKLSLRERAAMYEAAAAQAKVEAARLSMVTETRRLCYELGFLQRYEDIVREDRDTLSHYEELAKARYASGVGLEQGVVKLQAEITSADGRLLDIATRRAALTAQVNALRDRPDGTLLEVGPLPSYPRLDLVAGTLHDQALQHRPEIVAADAGIARGKTLVELARKDHDPDVTLGLTYGLVGRRIDAAGRAMPPENDGRDVLGVTASVNLPIWRQKLAAGVEQSVEEELVAEEQRRSVAASIAETLGDLSERIPLTWERLRLLEDVLVVQAHEALRSAENAYSSGTATSLDLLDAERVLLQVRINTARTRADYAVAVARLEGATGVPITGEPKS